MHLSMLSRSYYYFFYKNRTPHNILSKPLAAFPHYYCQPMDSGEREGNTVALQKRISDTRKIFFFKKSVRQSMLKENHTAGFVSSPCSNLPGKKKHTHTHTHTQNRQDFLKSESNASRKRLFII